MSNVSIWAELYGYFSQTNRGGLVKSLYKDQPFRNSWPYLSAVTVNIFITIAIFWLTSKSPSFLLLSILQVLVIYIFLNFLIRIRYKSYYLKNRLDSHPYFQRTNLLSYILFAELLSKSECIRKEDVPRLIEWENSKNLKYRAVSFFNTPVIIVIITGMVTLFLEYLKVQNLINLEYIPRILVSIVLLVWLSWAIFDTFKSDLKINSQICCYLKWWETEADT